MSHITGGGFCGKDSTGITDNAKAVWMAQVQCPPSLIVTTKSNSTTS